MSFDDLLQYIDNVEQVYFSEVYSEEAVRKDLQTRQAYDRYSTVGSGGRTDKLGEKQGIYIRDINDSLGNINKILNAARIHRSWDSTFISKCERCQNQLNKLLAIVRSF